MCSYIKKGILEFEEPSNASYAKNLGSNFLTSNKSTPATIPIKNPNTMCLIVDKMNMFKQLNHLGQK